MAKFNTYVVNVYDGEGKPIIADDRFQASSDKGAWIVGIERAFRKVQKDHKAGILRDSPASMEVTRL